MLTLVLLTLVGVVCSAPTVSFNYAVVQPTRTNYKQQQGNRYAFGYEFEGHGHHVVRNEDNVVNGLPLASWHHSVPGSGFTNQQLPVNLVPATQVNTGVEYQQRVDNVPLPSRAVSIFPLVKLAVDKGVVKPLGGSPQGVSEYAVSPHLASEVGSVSSLAYRLGAVPVAAVHDVQMRPNSLNSDNTALAPVLVHRETPKITLYTLEVPEQ
ncbi:hypothetical protein Pmani_028431 [Petrolisthes manimaculis]|uniref:Uncharacterized protein n=1 Tax=Petrolisthes manimaculis TaxID=1843537 RepID=A0AAE1NZI1_9EUCA|nr:hypothetical protein Pmani_028431 [Petrolisthes manimaculis]